MMGTLVLPDTSLPAGYLKDGDHALFIGGLLSSDPAAVLRKMLQQITGTPDVVCQNPRVPLAKKNQECFGLGLAPILLYSLAYPSVLYTIGFHTC